MVWQMGFPDFIYLQGCHGQGNSHPFQSQGILEQVREFASYCQSWGILFVVLIGTYFFIDWWMLLEL